ncbi:succinate dehydrogenase cytochrome b subunit [Mangrovimonas sp. AS39]|uniref:succinate dehydrogenase cytochrome b subunit n=1 Tax=Mangrovimonas TaxID=1211036 RepID=UPI0006B4507A|nr:MULTISPECIES: succinate dehydrogenase cytochrome b subunit [Mangrovimonas]MCF1190586.1 succinate dehydrogenase cytochrome b subunit [Mangrovimonas futianensis]MCF1193662.1 succinate dehydrogenase cytochrome b subunit [Mangrovimonas futianensis]MCF1420626.1 succinate dehydrogenase cytochrome b subunit [Mangrovimonas futianensis]NIK91136.1 succinate dehydrogenase cytochrome b subunit [Mangrovimonas sp. CR14]
MSGIFHSSIGRKFAMALSAFFLMIFLLLHFSVNLVSVFSEDAFNQASHFMGTNPLVQFLMQPILILGVIFHFVMGFVLELRNKNARSISYAKNNGGANSTWMSRNMIYSGLAILAFLVLHFIDFWLPEINTKFIQGDISGLNIDGNFRYYEELVHKFENPLRVGAYVIAFVFLCLHLLHGFMSAFQSVGANNKYTKALQGFGKAYAIILPVGFIFIALFHHFSH